MTSDWLALGGYTAIRLEGRKVERQEVSLWPFNNLPRRRTRSSPRGYVSVCFPGRLPHVPKTEAVRNGPEMVVSAGSIHDQSRRGGAHKY